MLGAFAQICDLLGAFFLAVEAIKLENFKALKNNLVKPFYKFLNPDIEIIDDADNKQHQEDLKKSAFSIWFRIFILFLTGVGVFLFLNNIWPSIAQKILFFINSSSAPNWLYYLILVPILIWLILMAGLIFYTVIVLFIEKIIIGFFDVLEIYTPKGTIGLIGFFLYLIAFLIKMYSPK